MNTSPDRSHHRPQRWSVRTVQQAALCFVLLASPAALVMAQDSAAAEPPVSNSALSAPLFYQLLLGELNVSSGEPGTGYSLVLDAARKQNDPDLFRRAVEIALQARSGDAALAAARAWSQAIPVSPEADRFELEILLALNRVGETGPVLRRLLDQAPAAARNDAINGIPRIYGRVTDKAAALQVVRDALAPIIKQGTHAAAAWTTIGFLELGSNQLPQALASARNGHAADQASPFPALLALDLMERGQTAAEAVVRGQLKASPPVAGSPAPVSLGYARILFDLQRNAEARSLLESLTRLQPEAMEPWLLLATLQVQDKRLPAATQSLQTYMGLARQVGDERAARGLTQAYLLMAQIAEQQRDFQAASAWLDRIENADDIMAAQMRRASLLAHQGQMNRARALLRNHPERRPEDARLKFVAEAQLLRDFKQWQQAFDVYGEAVTRFPKDSDLIYDQAMMAEKLNRIDDMERLFRQVIELKPDHHHAYNALGYSLADRGLRLAEARQLIEKAVSMAPDDAYIQDSLGWVEFRNGNIPRAVQILQAAYEKRPDAEIAAHLGEVLWVSGDKDRALKIWREGLLLASDNETLQGTLQRLRVKP
ncbi:tetratricopeptide repeat protein [Hydrogenophaga pseudoflava]|uniref:tetratricopeptide repeat protein n=1 Tax=Hydrogenophaga pseudoflava TaxID=47421 RepID=UPI0027E581F6|nr:tetratricopeptide repeat protein [Hydrogenophaga pseudoflava]MDQ7746749.1 tetratricopeptide repeat protein [Hydrogenophaga pseudoflava]